MTTESELRQQIQYRLLEDLQEKAARYQTLVESLAEPVVELSDEGNITFLNTAWTEQLGHPVAECLSRSFLDFCCPPYRSAMECALQNAGASPLSAEIQLAARDGTKVWYDLTLNRLDEGGSLRGLLLNVDLRRRQEELLQQNTRRLEETNRKLQEAARLKDEFLATMSHELRTPLNAILGSTQLLQAGIHGPVNSRQERDLDRITDNGNHLLELIGDILDYSRLRDGKYRLSPAPVHPEEICETVIRRLQPLAHDKNIAINLSNHAGRPELVADERALQQCLSNLLDNAIKHTAEGGRVGVSIVRDPHREEIQFRVEDNGVGIAPADQPKLFQPFTQIDGGLDRPHNGSGLGLSIVREYARLHGGGVDLASRPGQGSSFILRLPQNARRPSFNRHQ